MTAFIELTELIDDSFGSTVKCLVNLEGVERFNQYTPDRVTITFRTSHGNKVVRESLQEITKLCIAAGVKVSTKEGALTCSKRTNGMVALWKTIKRVIKQRLKLKESSIS